VLHRSSTHVMDLPALHCKGPFTSLRLKFELKWLVSTIQLSSIRRCEGTLRSFAVIEKLHAALDCRRPTNTLIILS